MYIYRGKLNWLWNAVDEAITIILPRTFDLGEPVCAYWQWTVDNHGNKKSNVEALGVIDRLEAGEARIGYFSNSHYIFDAEMVLGSDLTTLTMSYGTESRSIPTILELVYSDTSDKSQNSGCLIYTGNLDLGGFALNEMLLIVAPRGFGRKGQICSYLQWTKTANGSLNKLVDHQGPIKCFEETEAGTKIGFLFDGDICFGAAVSKNRDTMVLVVAKPGSEPISMTLHLSYPDRSKEKAINCSTKKALIARYATGGDNSIFDVSNMLTRALRFKNNDISMLYYDSQLADSTRLCKNGQEAPTATRFNRMFIDLIRNTEAGDVRFLYVDTHATISKGNGDPTECGEYSQGWDLAEMDDGRSVEIVSHKYIAESIEKYLHKQAKLTILCSSCAGSALLDTYHTDPSLLLAASDETRLNVKAFNGEYPWHLALLTVARKQKSRTRQTPTYSQSSKGGIVQGTDSLEPSPDPKKPTTLDSGQVETITHQDRQSIFDGSYITLERAIFLEHLPARRIRLPQGDL